MSIVSTAIKLVCNLKTIAGGLLVVTSGMALRSCSSLDEFVEVFNKVVLVSYGKLVEITEGSLCFTVQAETSSALKELWDMYKSGTLQSRLLEFLVTDKIKQLANGVDVEVTVFIDEQEYKSAYLDLMLQKEGKKLTNINFVPLLSATRTYSDKTKLSVGKEMILTGNFQRRKCVQTCAFVNKLHCFVSDIGLAGCNLFFYQFYHLIGFHCLGGPRFSKRTVIE